MGCRVCSTRSCSVRTIVTYKRKLIMGINDLSPLVDNLVVSREVEQSVEPAYPVVPLKREDYDHEGAMFVDAEGELVSVLVYNGAWDVHIESHRSLEDKHVASLLLRKPGFTFRDKRVKGEKKLNEDVARCYHLIVNRGSAICDAWKDRDVFAEWYMAQQAESSDHVCVLLSADPNAIMGPDNTILAHKALGKWVRASLSAYYDAMCPRHITFNGIPFGVHLGDLKKRPAYMIYSRCEIGFLHLRVNYITSIKEAFRRVLGFRREVLMYFESVPHLSLKNKDSSEIYRKFRNSMLDGTFYPHDLERVRRLIEIEKKYEAKRSERGIK